MLINERHTYSKQSSFHQIHHHSRRPHHIRKKYEYIFRCRSNDVLYPYIPVALNHIHTYYILVVLFMVFCACKWLVVFKQQFGNNTAKEVCFSHPRICLSLHYTTCTGAYRQIMCKNTVTLKSVIGVTQYHWKWRHLIDRTWVFIRLPL